MAKLKFLDGVDELGVLLYGHARNAYWYGSQLSVEETRALAPYQNATGMQVTSAVLAGMVWALENPKAGIVEADELDFRRCLQFKRPISARSSASTPIGRRSRVALASSRRTSTRAIPGNSATCWSDRRQHGQPYAASWCDDSERVSGANRLARHADERARPVSDNGAEARKAVAIERDQLGAEVVDDER